MPFTRLLYNLLCLPINEHQLLINLTGHTQNIAHFFEGHFKISSQETTVVYGYEKHLAVPRSALRISKN